MCNSRCVGHKKNATFPPCVIRFVCFVVRSACYVAMSRILNGVLSGPIWQRHTKILVESNAERHTRPHPPALLRSHSRHTLIYWRGAARRRAVPVRQQQQLQPTTTLYDEAEAAIDSAHHTRHSRIKLPCLAGCVCERCAARTCTHTLPHTYVGQVQIGREPEDVRDPFVVHRASYIER